MFHPKGLLPFKTIENILAHLRVKSNKKKEKKSFNYLMKISQVHAISIKPTDIVALSHIRMKLWAILMCKQCFILLFTFKVPRN